MIPADTQSITQSKLSVDEAQSQLTSLLLRQPAVTAIMTAYRQLQADQEAQQLLQTVRSLQSELRFSWSSEAEDKFHHLVDELNQRPSVIAYNQAERDLRDLMQSVDAVISQAAGVDFAVNAKKSCCGG
ncbi:MAG: YlbF family regulator [Chloroflexi bacterium]|nr:MAG: YlbF family regulator [Chloroflexota bacterium]